MRKIKTEKMKKTLYLISCLVLLASCGGTTVVDESKYTVSGKISDPASNGRRLLTGIDAVVRGESGGVVFDGPVDLSDTISCRYALKDIPAGVYDIVFSGQYYEASSYRVAVKSDSNLDVDLSPIRLLSIDTDTLYFGPRVRTREFSVTNVSEHSLNISLRGGRIESITNCRKQDYGWLLTLNPGETKRLTAEVRHEQEGVEEGYLKFFATGSQEWAVTVIPIQIETTGRDFYANLVGTVRDTEGHPLKGIPIFCECTDTAAVTDENGRYSFEDLPYRSSFRVTALPEHYKCKDSDFVQYVIDEIVIDLVLEPCTNHLVLDRKEIDFGTGSISAAAAEYNPETVTIRMTAETDEPVWYNLNVYNTEFGVVPGLNYWPTAQYVENYDTLTFTLSRGVSNEGTFRLNALLRTDNAGAYLIPITFTNTP